MKKRILIIPVLLFFSASIYGQSININAYTGYVFDDRVSSYYSSTDYYEGTIKGGFRWGLGVEYLIENVYGVELSYMRQDTKAPIEYWISNLKNTSFDVGISWLMLGGTRYHRKGQAELYAGMKLGAAFFNIQNPENGNSNSATKFAWEIHLGSNVFLNESFGIKLQADLASAVQGVGGGLYFGTGGAGAGVSSYSSMLQFGIGGGLVYRINKK